MTSATRPSPSRSRSLWMGFVLLLCAAPAVEAQRPAPAAPLLTHTPEAAALGSVRGTPAGAFAIEAGAGTLGSLLAMGLTSLAADCGRDDLRCTIIAVSAGGALGALGATAGVMLAARGSGSPRSAAGAALGAIAGTGVGLGVHWLLNRSSDRNLGDLGVVPIFAVSQGVLATVGSRALGRAR